MVEDNKNADTLSIHDQIEQLKQELEEITMNHLHLKTKMEQIETDLFHEIKQNKKRQQNVQVISTLDKDREISAYVGENRSFIQSIWQRKK